MNCCKVLQLLNHVRAEISRQLADEHIDSLITTCLSVMRDAELVGRPETTLANPLLARSRDVALQKFAYAIYVLLRSRDAVCQLKERNDRGRSRIGHPMGGCHTAGWNSMCRNVELRARGWDFLALAGNYTQLQVMCMAGVWTVLSGRICCVGWHWCC